MKDGGKTKKQVLEELKTLQGRLAGLELAETESKLVEEALGESEKKYRELYETAPVMLHTLNQKGVLIDCNKAFSETLGYTKKELIGRPVYDFEAAESRALAPKALKKVAKKGSLQGERDFITKDGRIITIEFNARIERTGEQDEFVIKTASKDITERKQAEEALQESEEKYRSLFDATPEGIIVTGAKGEIISANPAAARILGYKSPKEMENKSTAEHYTDPEQREKIFEVLMEKGHVKDFELRGQRKDGSRFDAIVSLKLHKDDSGNILRTEGVFRDITERKLAEEEMKRRLMKFNLEEGKLYLVKEPIPVLSLEAFKDLLQVGYSGLVISRTPGEEFENRVKSGFEFIRLAERGGEKTISPKFKEVESKLESLSGNWVVLIDRLDYLIFKNGFRKTLSFVHRLSELVYLKRVVVIMSIDLSTLKGRELRLLEKETREVRRRYTKRLPEDLLEVLWFIYQQNNLALKPSYTDVGRELEISRPTARKRVERLISTGFARANVKGNKKVLELTERGLSMFLK